MMMGVIKKNVTYNLKRLFIVAIIMWSNFAGNSINAATKTNDKDEKVSFGPLTYVSSTPVSGATTVARNANIVLNFNEAVASGTINATNIRVSGNQTGIIAASFSGGGTSQITINPTTDFKPGELVTVALMAGLQSQSTNEGLVNYYTIQFTVATGQNNYYPYITNASKFTIGSINNSQLIKQVDLDGDGDMDIVTNSELDGEVIWYENDGSQNFTEHLIGTFASPRSLDVGDFDNDGDLDLVVGSFLDASADGGKVNFFRNDGSQVFTPIQSSTGTSLNTTVERVMKIADLNGDGNLDLAYTSNSGIATGGRFFIIYLDGAFDYIDIDMFDVSMDNLSGLSIADIDADGDLDILINSRDDDKVGWFENNGVSFNGTPNIVDIESDRSRSCTAIDLDGDGDVDLISSSVRDDSISWYKNDGNQNFTKIFIDDGTIDAPQEIVTVDVDGDGDIDILSSAINDNTVIIYVNNGDATFTKTVITNLAIGSRFVSFADMDADGDVDIVGTSVGDDLLSWYENKNNIPVSFTTSSPTIGATNIGINESVVLNFDEIVKGTTINATNITVNGSVSGTIAGTFTEQNTNQITFTPTGNFPYNEVITVVLTNGLTSMNNDVLSNPSTITFTTAKEPLSFTGSSPLDNAIDVLVDASIVLDFDTNVLGTTINTTNIAVSGSTSGVIAGTFTGQDTNQITFAPASNFAYDEVITVSLTNGLTPLAGGALSNPSVLTFTTQNQLTFTSSTPTDTTTDVLINDVIVLNFNTNVLGATINATNIAVSGSTSGVIAGTFTGQDTNQITFTPTSNFGFNEVITVTLASGLTSPSGVVLSNPSGFTFTTESQLALTSIAPTDTATDVLINDVIVLNFNTNVLGATINATNIAVSGSTSGVIAGTFTGQDTNQITFTPTSNFGFNEVITVTLASGLTSPSGVVLSNPSGFTFTTEPQLALTTTAPTDTATDVLVNDVIVLNFNTNVLGATINATNIAVSGSTSGVIAGTFTGQDTNQITFTPTSNFGFNEVITVTLASGLTSPSGVVLSNPSGFTFTIQASEIRVLPKVFLQGAYDTASGLMRDDLRVASLIPTTSPYPDAITANAAVFTTTSNDAIVDWVYVELRDKTNISTVLGATSALVQKDGDVVAVDGTSSLSFVLNSDDYYVSISHRNHINIVTDQVVSLTNTITNLNFTNNVSAIRGTTNAVQELTSGIYGMFAGDASGDNNIQTTDTNSAKVAVGDNGYDINDINMNGDVQTTDLNIILLLIGKSIQF